MRHLQRDSTIRGLRGGMMVDRNSIGRLRPVAQCNADAASAERMQKETQPVYPAPARAQEKICRKTLLSANAVQQWIMSFHRSPTSQRCPVCMGRGTNTRGSLCPMCNGIGEI